MNLTRIDAPSFDLAITLNSGQVFHWEKVEAGFCGTIGERAVYVEQRGELLKIKIEGGALRRHRENTVVRKVSRPTTAATAGSRELTSVSVARVVAHYFALDHPLEAICASFPRDPAMNAARDYCRGLRIIRQPKWECLATFICSSMKQVAHIRQISHKLRERFSEPRRIRNDVVYPFPSPERIAASSEKELGKCALGYRAKNLLATARRIAS